MYLDAPFIERTIYRILCFNVFNDTHRNKYKTLKMT